MVVISLAEVWGQGKNFGLPEGKNFGFFADFIIVYIHEILFLQAFTCFPGSSFYMSIF